MATLPLSPESEGPLLFTQSSGPMRNIVRPPHPFAQIHIPLASSSSLSSASSSIASAGSAGVADPGSGSAVGMGVERGAKGRDEAGSGAGSGAVGGAAGSGAGGLGVNGLGSASHGGGGGGGGGGQAKYAYTDGGRSEIEGVKGVRRLLAEMRVPNTLERTRRQDAILHRDWRETLLFIFQKVRAPSSGGNAGNRSTG